MRHGELPGQGTKMQCPGSLEIPKSQTGANLMQFTAGPLGFQPFSVLSSNLGQVLQNGDWI